MVLVVTNKFQIKNEYDRFSKFFAETKTGVVYGGTPYADDKKMFEENPPHVVIGTPGRVRYLFLNKT